MTLKLSSNLFSVSQPCGYENPLIDYLEETENEWHNDKEFHYVTEQVQLPLFGKPIKVLDPEWKQGRYKVNYYRFVSVLSKIWINHLQERIDDSGLKAKVIFKGADLPKEYNFKSDAALFDMEISGAEINRLYFFCKDNTDFEKYLYDFHRSREGYMSFMADNVEDWLTDFNRDRFDRDRHERAICQTLDFFLFPTEAEREEWNKDFDEACYETGQFLDCLDFIEGQCYWCYNGNSCGGDYCSESE